MADATLAELTDHVLQELSVIPGGDTAEAEDAAFVQTRITSVNEELRELEICYWSDTAFPQHIKIPLAIYVACQCASALYPGAPAEAMQFKLANETKALNRLRALTMSKERVDKPTRAEYF